jgi:hypothetical protein
VKALTVRYERLYSLGNYEHAKYGIELTVEEGEKASDVLEQAKRFVRQQNTEAMEREKAKIDRARAVLANRRNFTVGDVEDAEELVRKAEEREQGEFPF